jgi:hypothetical protein
MCTVSVDTWLASVSRRVVATVIRVHSGYLFAQCAQGLVMARVPLCKLFHPHIHMARWVTTLASSI